MPLHRSGMPVKGRAAAIAGRSATLQPLGVCRWGGFSGISGLVVEYIVAIDVTRARYPADALFVHILLVTSGLCT